MPRTNVADLTKRVDQQDATITMIREEFISFRAESKAQWEKMYQEVHIFLNGDKPAAPTQPKQEVLDPWRMRLEDFVGFRDGCKPDWSDAGNARVSQRLAKHLKRTSGHAEGQLYINWCDKVGRAVVKQYWSSMGFSEIPGGL
jgi:hypothetical protein